MRFVDVVVAAVLASGCTHSAASAVSETIPEHMGVCTASEQCSAGGGTMTMPLAVAVGSAVAGVLTLALVRRIAAEF